MPVPDTAMPLSTCTQLLPCHYTHTHSYYTHSKTYYKDIEVLQACQKLKGLLHGISLAGGYSFTAAADF